MQWDAAFGLMLSLIWIDVYVLLAHRATSIQRIGDAQEAGSNVLEEGKKRTESTDKNRSPLKTRERRREKEPG